MNYAFIIDNRKCIGCHACTVACKAEHNTPIGVNRTWVKYIEKGQFPNTRRHFSVMRCNHCDDAPCVEICPVTALFRRKDGIVDFDKQRCIGCKACTQACPYDALYLDPETHTAAKCNYCAHRIELALEPACVNVCPEHAIVSGDIDDPDSEISQLLAREQVTTRKPEKGTKPKVFYIEADQASIQPALTEQSSDYMWSSQAFGVGHYARYAEKRSRQADGSQMLVQLTSHPLTGEPGHDVLVPKGGDEKKTLEKARDVLRENIRRVYDAPAKGVMWGWEVSAYLWTKSIAAGAFIVPFSISKLMGLQVSDLTEWMAIGLALIFLVLTGALLIKDLDRPDRFLYVLFRPQWKSWLVRGAYFMTAFGTVLALCIAAKLLGFSRGDSLLVGLGIITGLLTAVYTAFLFAQARGRDFWQSPLLSFHFLIHSIMAGAALLVLLAPMAHPGSQALEALRWILFAAILFHLLSLVVEFGTPHSTDDSRTTSKMILRGRFKVWFWLGVVVVGNLLPLGLLLPDGGLFLSVAGGLTLVGIYVVEYIWVRAPQLIPLS